MPPETVPDLLQRTEEKQICNAITAFLCLQEPLLTIEKQRKLVCFGCIAWHDTLSKTVLQRCVKGGH